MFNDITGYAAFFAHREKRILVCGSRDFNNYSYTEQQVFDKLDAIHDVYLANHYVTVVQGEARGVDLTASAWAKARLLPQLCVPADWQEYGKLAGFLRNETMLTIGKPDIVVAFPGGAGTKDMKTRAQRHGIELIEIEF